MDVLITAIFQTQSAAKCAADDLKSKISILNLSLSPVAPRELTLPHLAPLFSSADADRAEQTHGNLIPPLLTHLSQHDGKTRIKLILNTKDTETAKSILRKNKANTITVKKRRD